MEEAVSYISSQQKVSRSRITWECFKADSDYQIPSKCCTSALLSAYPFWQPACFCTLFMPLFFGCVLSFHLILQLSRTWKSNVGESKIRIAFIFEKESSNLLKKHITIAILLIDTYLGYIWGWKAVPRNQTRSTIQMRSWAGALMLLVWQKFFALARRCCKSAKGWIWCYCICMPVISYQLS